MNNTLSPMLLYCRKILHFASGSHHPGVDYFRMPSCSIMFYCSLPSSQLPPTHQLALQQIWPRFVSHKVYFIIIFFFTGNTSLPPSRGLGMAGILFSVREEDLHPAANTFQTPPGSACSCSTFGSIRNTSHALSPSVSHGGLRFTHAAGL